MKKIFSLILAVVMLFSFNSFVFADGPETEEPVGEGEVDARVIVPDNTRGSFSGYGSKYCYTDESSFSFTVTGFPLLSAGLTIKTSCSSNNASCVLSIRRPNGGYIVQNTALGANDEDYYEFYFPTTGTYTISYLAYSPDAQLHIECWIYG